MNILLIDDDKSFLFVNSLILGKLKYINNINKHSNVQDAVSFIKSDFEKEGRIPDLILLDINMPVLDGFDFLHLVQDFREDLKKKLKVAMLTSSIDPRDKQLSFKFPQVIEFFEKPLNLEKFESTIKRISN
ncbi:MAG: response regulator [Bacteroidetes bacterium]|nr:response regulator [Bacteroidota bacterium]